MTVLRCVAGVNSDHLTSGTLSLLREDGTEHRPTRVRDRLGEAVVFDHAPDVEFLDGNHAKAVDQSSSDLVNKIMTPVAHPLMDTRENSVGFLSRRASLFCFSLFPASLCESIFIAAEEARIVYELAIGQRQERVEASVKAHGFSRLRQEVALLFHREAHEPLVADAVNAARLDLARKRPVQTHLDRAVRLSDFGQAQTAVDDREPCAWEAETIVPVTFSTREARGLSCLYPAKERLESEVNAHRHILKNLAMHLGKF